MGQTVDFGVQIVDHFIVVRACCKTASIDKKTPGSRSMRFFAEDSDRMEPWYHRSNEVVRINYLRAKRFKLENKHLS
jgi:hypothetical protein